MPILSLPAVSSRGIVRPVDESKRLAALGSVLSVRVNRIHGFPLGIWNHWHYNPMEFIGLQWIWIRCVTAGPFLFPSSPPPPFPAPAFPLSPSNSLLYSCPPSSGRCFHGQNGKAALGRGRVPLDPQMRSFIPTRQRRDPACPCPEPLHIECGATTGPKLGCMEGAWRIDAPPSTPRKCKHHQNETKLTSRLGT